MITRRSVLAATGGVAGLAAARAAGAQTPTVSTQGRNGTMQIARVRLAGVPAQLLPLLLPVRAV
jgi:hypothetical protein